MLTYLKIDNFAIVKSLEIDWVSGMSTITGETGAGKSIAIDALSACLGDRAEASMVRPSAKKAEVIANFDISLLPATQNWLAENELDADGECILRRVISKEGRSKGFINGVAVPLTQLKQLGQLLVSIHGQHAHQSLLKSEHQRTLIDEYAGHHKLIENTQATYRQWHSLKKEFETLISEKSQDDAKRQLLEYQVNELNEFSLQPGEYESIETEHKKLSSGQSILEQCHYHLASLYENEQQNAFNLVQSAANHLAEFTNVDEKLKPITDLLFEASVQIEEASRELSAYSESLDLDPTALQEVEERMSAAITLARKHAITPNTLPDFHASLVTELAGISHNAERLVQLEKDIESAHATYIETCNKLSDSRQKHSKTLNKLITESMQELSMPDGKFEIVIEQLSADKGQIHGLDKVDFKVSANPGQPMQQLGKVASGGELSRISLAIQVIIAAKVTTPTLIFDEVDVGISGPTAATVGKLLRVLGGSTQVICITHLPQVASQGHQQLFVKKEVVQGETSTVMQTLTQPERITELARLLGGETISETTLANAKELLVV